MRNPVAKGQHMLVFSCWLSKFEFSAFHRNHRWAGLVGEVSQNHQSQFHSHICNGITSQHLLRGRASLSDAPLFISNKDCGICKNDVSSKK